MTAPDTTIQTATRYHVRELDGFGWGVWDTQYPEAGETSEVRIWEGSDRNAGAEWARDLNRTHNARIALHAALRELGLNFTPGDEGHGAHSFSIDVTRADAEAFLGRNQP